MNTLIAAAIRCSLLFLVTASLFSVRPVQAGYIVTFRQVGEFRFVATGSGAIDLTGLTLGGSGEVPSLIFPSAAAIRTGPTSALVDTYGGFGVISGPTSFGNGFVTYASSGSGDMVGIFGEFLPSLDVPTGYVSGNALSDSSTYANVGGLGVMPGTYVWTWGPGANQNFTLIIGPAGVPDGGSTVSLLGCALLGLAVLRRKLCC